jgi:hypothetical protein
MGNWYEHDLEELYNVKIPKRDKTIIRMTLFTLCFIFMIIVANIIFLILIQHNS